MDLTREFVRAKNPCAEGYRWFLRHFEVGGNYQELLDALVNAGRVDDACWLLSQFGPTHTRLVLDDLNAEAMVFSGSLEGRCENRYFASLPSQTAMTGRDFYILRCTIAGIR